MNSYDPSYHEPWGSVQARIRSASRALERLVCLPWIPPEPDETGWAMTFELERFRLLSWLGHLRDEERGLALRADSGEE